MIIYARLHFDAATVRSRWLAALLVPAAIERTAVPSLPSHGVCSPSRAQLERRHFVIHAPYNELLHEVLTAVLAARRDDSHRRCLASELLAREANGCVLLGVTTNAARAVYLVGSIRCPVDASGFVVVTDHRTALLAPISQRTELLRPHQRPRTSQAGTLPLATTDDGD